MNSKLFRPFSACARHARNRFAFGHLIWPLGMAIMLSLAFPIVSQGASLASLSGTVFVDRDLSGVFKTDDWGVRSALIQLLDQYNQLIEVYTDSQGRYSFTDLASGIYTVLDTTPSSRGNTAIVGEILDAGGNLVTSGLGKPNSALVEISNINLTAGSTAQNYNFGNDQYPLQLYSKSLLVGNSSHQIQPAVVTPVPEPALVVHFLAMAGMACGWAGWRRRQTKS